MGWPTKKGIALSARLEKESGAVVVFSPAVRIVDISATAALRINAGHRPGGPFPATGYFSRADFSRAYFSGIFFCADLSFADLSGADLDGAYLREANLRETDLSGAFLRGAATSAAR